MEHNVTVIAITAGFSSVDKNKTPVKFLQLHCCQINYFQWTFFGVEIQSQKVWRVYLDYKECLQFNSYLHVDHLDGKLANINLSRQLSVR